MAEKCDRCGHPRDRHHEHGACFVNWLTRVNDFQQTVHSCDCERYRPAPKGVRQGVLL